MVIAGSYPRPWCGGLLAFITNHIPNIGFAIGVMAPAVLGLLRECDPRQRRPRGCQRATEYP